MTPLKIVAIAFFSVGFATSILANLMLIFGGDEATRMQANRALIASTNTMVAAISIWLLFG